MLRNVRGGGWVYAQALLIVTRGWGGLRQRYVRSFFFTSDCLVYRHVRHGFQNNLTSISNNMFLCILLTTKTGSHINNYP